MPCWRRGIFRNQRFQIEAGMITIGIEEEIMIVGISGMRGGIRGVRGVIEDVVVVAGEGGIVIERDGCVVIVSSGIYLRTSLFNGGGDR